MHELFEPLYSSQVWLQLIMAFVAALGYALLFNMRRSMLLPAAIGGFLTWAVFAGFRNVLGGVFLPCLIASAFAGIYAEYMGRHYKIPTATFSILAVIPLIPGSGLYNTMQAAVKTDLDAFMHYGLITGEYALAIAFGISLIWAWVQMRRSFVRRRRLKKEEAKAAKTTKVTKKEVVEEKDSKATKEENPRTAQVSAKL